MKISGFSAGELARFRAYQRAAFDTLVAVSQTLREGDREDQVARRLRRRFHEQGVHHYFHVPVVMFGVRTAYPGQFGQLEARATDQCLQAGMPVILDAAPIYEGFTVDTSLALNFGPSAGYERLMSDLWPFRNFILERVRARDTFRAIALQVDERIRALGYENCHRKHIAAVLGHRLTRVPDRWLNRRRIWGLGVEQVGWFFAKSIAAERWGGDGSPNWNHRRSSDHPPTPGLWAVEPHISQHNVGVKFEEILVITEDDAYYLDNDLPHHRRWTAAGLSVQPQHPNSQSLNGEKQ